ncbi:MAG TPA: hypothetical protein VJ783_32430 [Pirellulales bacterium]|nr:hypothetical protein [Pirellulales bacterium]
MSGQTNSVGTFRENAVLLAIVAGAVAAAALVVCDALVARNTKGAGDRSVEFQSLVRGLGFGCQCDLGHGVRQFDPRLQNGEPYRFSGSTFGQKRCRWHPLMIFPAPPAATDAGRSEE